MELGSFMGNFQFKPQHFAVDGIRGQQRNHCVRRTDPVFNFTRPIHAHGKVAVDEDLAAMASELSLDILDQFLIRLAVALVQQDDLRSSGISHKGLFHGSVSSPATGDLMPLGLCSPS